MILPASAFPLMAQIVSGGGAMPNYVGKTALTEVPTTTSSSVDFSSTGRVSGDLLLILVKSNNRGVSTPSGFSIASPAQSFGTAGANESCRLDVFMKISDGNESTITISQDGLSFMQCLGLVYRAVNSSSPIHAGVGSVNTSAGTTATWGGLTTTVDNVLILNIAAISRDLNAVVALTSISNTNLADLTERHNQTTAFSSGGGLFISDGKLPSAGLSGGTTATIGGAANFCFMTLAIAPA